MRFGTPCWLLVAKWIILWAVLEYSISFRARGHKQRLTWIIEALIGIHLLVAGVASIDFPDLGLLSPVRGFSASSLQALSLFNNDFTLFQSQAMAKHLQDSMPSLEECVRESVWRIWARGPKQDELKEFCRFAEEHSLAELCRVMMNSNEFLFVD
jgi:Protein of unknown function (DUF1553)